MNKELEEVIKRYATGEHKDLNDYLLGKSKNNLISVLLDLLTMYITDKNSSTIREFITVILAGYKHKEGKIGYNGFKQSSIITGKTTKCEAKPKNISRNKKSGLNGGGNFTDYTYERWYKDLNADINMLVSGFVDGKLIYIFEFPFKFREFKDHLKDQLDKRFGAKRPKGLFLRSASFNYKHYKNCQELRIVYLLEKNELEKYKDNFGKGFYNWLAGKGR